MPTICMFRCSADVRGLTAVSTVEEYLAKGFDRRTAEYFANGRRKILSVAPCKDLMLVLTFDNGEK